MKIIFMGTPDFAVPCLTALVKDGHEICAVFTQPDKPKGRKFIMTPPPVKEKALSLNIPIYQPVTLRENAILAQLELYRPDVIVVVAYGKILPLYVLEFPQYGCINVHASLLPKYRGAGPIQRSIMDGETETGVTTMFMEKGVDTGDMLLWDKTQITDDDTSETLHERLSMMGAKLICTTLMKMEKGELSPIPQDDLLSTYAPMLEKADGHLDFSLPVQEVFNRLRGVTSWPGAYAYLDGRQVKLFTAKKGGASPLPAGTAVAKDDALQVTCGDGNTLLFYQIQMEGSKKMGAKEYLRGHPIIDAVLLK